MKKKPDAIINSFFPLIIMIVIIVLSALMASALIRTGILWAILDGLSR
jgi:hypothetical protein